MKNKKSREQRKREKKEWKEKRKKFKKKRKREQGRTFTKTKNITVFIYSILGILSIMITILMISGILTPDIIKSWFGG